MAQEQERRRNWLAIALGTIAMMFSYFPYAAAFATPEGEPAQIDAGLLGIGVVMAPFVFMTVGFVSRNAQTPKRVLQSMGLLLLLGLALGLLSPVVGAAAGFGVGGSLCLNQPDLEGLMKWRLWATGFMTVYVLSLLVVITPAGVFAGGLLPLLMIGFADEYTAWRGDAAGIDLGPTATAHEHGAVEKSEYRCCYPRMLTIMARSTKTSIAIASGVVVAVLAIAVGLLVAQRRSGPSGDLSEAVKSGDADLVRAHLEAGADPDEPQVLGLTPLMRAAVRNDVAIVTLLLSAGADLNAVAPEGLTAAHVAAEADAADSLEALVAAGADLGDLSSNGMNALHHAADLGSAGAIEFIAGQGVDLDVRSEVITQGHGHPRDRGSSALGIAAHAGQLEAVETLLSLGASVDALSATGHSPLLLAVFSGQSQAVVTALLEAGADPGIEASCAGGGCSAEAGNALHWARLLNEPEMVLLLEGALQR